MPTVTFFKTYGMNNVDDPKDVGAPVPKIKQLIYTEGVLFENVDPNNNGGCSLRKGRETVYNGAPHSGWGNGNEAYFVENGQLKRFFPDNTATVIREAVAADRRMVYCQVNDIVVYSNGAQWGILEKGVDVPPFVPTLPFKERMVAGEFIEYYNGRLYALKNLEELPGQSALYCSDSLDVPGGIESMDERFNIVAVFDGTGSLLLAVDDGLFVAAGNETFFFLGADPVVGGFDQRSKALYGAIPHASVSFKAELLGIDGVTGTAGMWASERNICIGGNGGFFLELDKIAIQPGTEGAGILREQNGVAHCLFTVCNVTDEKYNAFQPRAIDVETITL